MDKMEKALRDKKEDLQMVEVPAELEERLRNALNQRPVPKNRKRKGLIAAGLVFLLLLTYNFDTLAYYGKKIAGYDTLTYGSLKELNEEAAGQEINQSYTFPNGVEITLDGVMFDENELVAFYKIQNNGVKWDDINILYQIGGLNPLGYHAKSGQGEQVDAGTQVWVQSFTSPAFYEKALTFDMQMLVPGTSVTGNIEFRLDRAKAMKRVVKQALNKKVRLDGLVISLDTLTASRLSTVIEGRIEALPQAGPGTLNQMFDNADHPRMEFDILVDGKKLAAGYANMHFAGNRLSFSSEAMGLPTAFTAITIENIRLVKTVMVDQEVTITPETKDLRITDDLIVKNVTAADGNTSVTVLSRGTPAMGLFIDGEQVKNMNDQEFAEDKPESQTPTAKTLQFQGQSEEMTLAVKAINYIKLSPESIDVPLQ